MDFTDNNIAKESAADEHLQNLQDKAATVGLKINNHKAKILLVNYQLSNQTLTLLKNLEIVDNFKYFDPKIAFLNYFK